MPCDTSKLDEKGCHGAPDWIIEIVSPGTPEYDYITKLSRYQESGVREYWIADPKTKTVAANIYEDLEIDFRQLEL